MAPLPKFVEPELRPRLHERPPGFFVPTDEPIIFLDHGRQPLGDGESDAPTAIQPAAAQRTADAGFVQLAGEDQAMELILR
jgi:hypothetical protein